MGLSSRLKIPSDISISPEWLQLGAYALCAALLLLVLFKIPVIGRLLRALFSFGVLAFCLLLLLRQAPYDPTLGRLTQRLGLDDQQVVGNAVRIAMRSDGHFWARVHINGVERLMLIDSGATITALSPETARLAGVKAGIGLVPVLLRTANGTVRAQTGSVDRLGLGPIDARNLKVVISPALGSMDIIGMNFLSQLASWRVEGRTLILTPRRTLSQKKR